MRFGKFIPLTFFGFLPLIIWGFVKFVKMALTKLSDLEIIQDEVAGNYSVDIAIPSWCGNAIAYVDHFVPIDVLMVTLNSSVVTYALCMTYRLIKSYVPTISS